MDANNMNASLLDPTITNNRGATSGSITPSGKALKTSKSSTVSTRFSAKTVAEKEKTKFDSEIYNQDQKNVVFING